ncbi:MAG TPA: glycosyltransferase family 39 protein [Candidatus Sulfomarinibacteraceae bacterium]|nr:glycosyltransferase family 39 protein [Candidatus Sulfomarinibacteraceae bacterium]
MEGPTTTETGWRRRSLWLAAIVVLAALLRLTALGRESLWLDEAISYLAADLDAPRILDNTIKDPHPPFYYLLLHIWLRVAPHTDFAIRLPGVLFDLLLIPAIYALGHALFRQERAALVAALMAAISPFHVFYSHELRMYTLLTLLSTLVVLAYLLARRRRALRWWLLFGLTALMAIYTHLFAFFLLLGIGLHALLRRKDRQSLHRTLLVGLGLGLLFIPWIAILTGESQYGLGSLRPLARSSPQSAAPLKPLTTLIFLLFGYATSTWYSVVALFLTVALAAILLLERRRLIRQQKMRPLLLPALLIACSVGLPVAIYYARPFFLPERTMAAASPLLLLSLAWLTTVRRSLLPALVALCGAVMLLGALLYLSADPLKPPYRDAIHYVQDQRRPGDAVLHTSDGSYLPALRYVDFAQHGLLEGDPDPRKPRAVYEAFGGEVWGREQATQRGDRLWLIVAREHSVSWQEQQVDYFDGRYDTVEKWLFSGIEVRLYELSETASSPMR